MNPVSAADFSAMAIEHGLRERAGKQVALESGKRFYIGTYARSSAMPGHTPR
jgi:hypothetical protein